MKPEIKVGQVYRDKDKRMLDGHRYLYVESVFTRREKLDTAHFVQCRADGSPIAERRVDIAVKNLQTRFELVEGRGK